MILHAQRAPWRRPEGYAHFCTGVSRGVHNVGTIVHRIVVGTAYQLCVPAPTAPSALTASGDTQAALRPWQIAQQMPL